MKAKEILSKLLPLVKVFNPVVGGALELIKDKDHREDNKHSETSKAAIPVSATAGALSTLLLSIFSSLPPEQAAFFSSFISAGVYGILIITKIDR